MKLPWVTGGLLMTIILVIPHFLGLSESEVKQWTLIVAYVGFIMTSVKAIQEWHDATMQREREHKWKKSELAMKLLDAMRADTAAAQAMMMLDWTGREYISPSGQRFRVTFESVAAALRPHQDTANPEHIERFDDVEVFIRDCFDHLFDHFERMAHIVEIQLIDFEDIRGPLSYWAKQIVLGRWDPEDPFRKFLQAYEFEKALGLINRLLEYPSQSPNKALNPTGANKESL